MQKELALGSHTSDVLYSRAQGFLIKLRALVVSELKKLLGQAQQVGDRSRNTE